MPPPGAIDAWSIWYQLMESTGAFVCALAPVCAVVRLASAQRRPRVPAIVATGTDALYQYQASVPVGVVAGTFSLDLWLIF